MRTAEINRVTNETDISLWIDLDGDGKASEINSGVGFLDHMLTLLAKHARFDLDVYCKGDTNVISCTGRDERGNIYKRHLFDKAELDSSYKYNMYLGKPLPLVKVKTNVNNQRKLLVITDSFGSCFVQFLTQHYSEITVVMPSEIKGSVRNMVDPGKFDQTLFLFGIDSMSDSSIFEKLN